MKKADIGLIGLAVMGENLVMNMESRGFTVAVFNRTTEKVDKFVNGRAAGKNIIGCHSLEELVDNLEKPRKVFMMVKAGQAVDDMIEKLLPLLDDGDILIDGGNSHFPDTIRRTAYVESKGKLYIGKDRLMRDQIITLKHKTDRVIPIRIPVPVFVFLRRNPVYDQVSAVIPVQSSDDI